MQPSILDPNDLKVESFELEAAGTAGSKRELLGPTQWPMDCPETLPRFC